jgi:hypothetical protein
MPILISLPCPTERVSSHTCRLCFAVRLGAAAYTCADAPITRIGLFALAQFQTALKTRAVWNVGIFLACVWAMLVRWMNHWPQSAGYRNHRTFEIGDRCADNVAINLPLAGGGEIARALGAIAAGAGQQWKYQGRVDLQQQQDHQQALTGCGAACREEGTNVVADA